mmetsp:Transcript_32378/g.53599  ORF Transcript_32378/g.53599 Transcript_32378/m.53599 type:complete len:341 (-) Transcript_32378:482-1504(-)
MLEANRFRWHSQRLPIAASAACLALSTFSSASTIFCVSTRFSTANASRAAAVLSSALAFARSSSLWAAVTSAAARISTSVMAFVCSANICSFCAFAAIAASAIFSSARFLSSASSAAATACTAATFASASRVASCSSTAAAVAALAAASSFCRSVRSKSSFSSARATAVAAASLSFCDSSSFSDSRFSSACLRASAKFPSAAASSCSALLAGVPSGFRTKTRKSPAPERITRTVLLSALTRSRPEPLSSCPGRCVYKGGSDLRIEAIGRVTAGKVRTRNFTLLSVRQSWPEALMSRMSLMIDTRHSGALGSGHGTRDRREISSSIVSTPSPPIVWETSPS